MEYTTEMQNHTAVIRLKGQFTFNDNQQFRNILNLLDQKNITAMSVNFSQVDFIDSAALGMLLLLRDEAQSRKIHLDLTGATGQIRKMFEVAKFNVIFNDQAS